MTSEHERDDETMSLEPYRFRLAIRGRQSWGKDWEQAFRDELSRVGWQATALGPDGQMRDVGGDPMGRYEFQPRAAHAVVGTACPYVGEVVGFLAFEWWEGYMEFEDRRFFLELFFAASHGYVERTDTGQVYDSVVLRTFRLAEVVSKHGFEDGGFFLHGLPAYDAGVRAHISAAVERIGLTGSFITYGTSHNPVRIDDFDQRDGYRIFCMHVDDPIDLWGFETRITPELHRLLSDMTDDCCSRS